VNFSMVSEYILLFPLLAALLFAFVAAGTLTWWTRRRKRPAGARGAAGGAAIQMACSVCRRELVFTAAELIPLSPVEMALVVRNAPRMVGRKTSEYVCPYCEAAHCFVTDSGRPEWIGANFYTPQATSSHCSECHRPLRLPYWSKGLYDKRLGDVPELPGDCGLVCQRCGAVCCVACCQRLTHKPGEEGSLMCPRCAREGLSVFYHPG
jgi:hypothetical protein